MLALLAVCTEQAKGQTNFDKFCKLFAEKDMAKAKDLLVSWEGSGANDPEFYTCAFNYYFSTSRKEMLAMQREEPENESLQITDSAGAIVGCLASNTEYIQDKVDSAFLYIDRGIAQFPDRLDMRFGKIYALGMVGDYSMFTTTLVKTIERSVVNNNRWLWTENEKREKAREFLLENIQAYLVQLYNTEDDSLLKNMITIGDLTLLHYPKNVEVLSTTATAYLLTKRYDQAIAYLKQAEGLNPHDAIVLNNLARAYSLQGATAKAIEYYRLAKQYGDKDIQQQAQHYLEQLEK